MSHFFYLPFEVIILRDLLYVEDGNPDWYTPTPGDINFNSASVTEDEYSKKQLVNFSKIELVGRVLCAINEAQRVPYVLQRIPLIQCYLNNVFFIEDIEELEMHSKNVEPPSTET